MSHIYLAQHFQKTLLCQGFQSIKQPHQIRKSHQLVRIEWGRSQNIPRMVDIPPFIFSFIDFLLNHRFAVPELDADGFRVLHRDLLDDLPDELIVKFRIARGAFHDSRMRSRCRPWW